MSRIILRVAQIVGVLVLAGVAVGIVVGLAHWLLGVALVLAIPLGAWWLYKKVADRKATPAGFLRTPETAAGNPGGRRADLESRAVLDEAGRCGWCGSTTLHKDEFGFPVTPLTYHRAEIDSLL